jgi:hypothetical protein
LFVPQEMEQRFLFGQDASVDYAAIDRDVELDEHWAGVAAQDAEDAYFDELDLEEGGQPGAGQDVGTGAGAASAGLSPLGPDEYDY